MPEDKQSDPEYSDPLTFYTYWKKKKNYLDFYAAFITWMVSV